MKTLVGASVLLVALSACGGGDSPVGIGPGAAGPSGVFVSQSGHDLVEGTAVRLDFTEDGRLLASAGCNTMSGQVDTGGGKLVVNDLATTEMGCDGPRHAQDEWLSAFLSATPTWRLDGDTLVLTGADELVLGREATAPLLGTKWVVDTLISGEVASSVPAGATASLTFSADTVAVDTGCNTGSAAYKLSGGAVVFEQPVLTRMGCLPGLMTLEDAMTAVLDGKADLTTDGQTMTLLKDGQGIRLRAT